MELSWEHEPLALIGRQRPLSVHLVKQSPDSARRRELEAFIRARFVDYYAARIHHFMPCLLGFEDDVGQVQAVVGLRPADDTEGLFLERYLDEPIESVISKRTGLAVARRDIVEVGNFAARGPGGARLMITALTDLLDVQGFRWVVFTGTAMLLNSFGRLDLSMVELGLADPARMGADLADWGHYYDTHPQVMAANITDPHNRAQFLGLHQRFAYRPLYQEVADVACG
ncbi:Thermostable hemolysin [Azotobacter beijerinckii]|uniref:Thermostable hemolysin n=1 Tax=Azotobacter beijerinckii TaxID=170623 RepID=A0A1H9LM90_9GAMM|nr:thermostable hemolysin [Azotobacter beijerinckii]SER12622.1 Thermostable hemolysin [Azotobacter beijerinckii]